MSLRSFGFTAPLGLILAASLGCTDTAGDPPPLAAGQHEHYHVHAVDVQHDHDHGGTARGGHEHGHVHPDAAE
ncbi:MAG: hypothetical protein KDA44_07085 [Planctomycetales bacterium]|nr:hypothetical protein [Planctomycetales bacterium]